MYTSKPGLHRKYPNFNANLRINSLYMCEPQRLYVNVWEKWVRNLSEIVDKVQ